MNRIKYTHIHICAWCVYECVMYMSCMHQIYIVSICIRKSATKQEIHLEAYRSAAIHVNNWPNRDMLILIVHCFTFFYCSKLKLVFLFSSAFQRIPPHSFNEYYVKFFYFISIFCCLLFVISYCCVRFLFFRETGRQSFEHHMNLPIGGWISMELKMGGGEQRNVLNLSWNWRLWSVCVCVYIVYCLNVVYQFVFPFSNCLLNTIFILYVYKHIFLSLTLKLLLWQQSQSCTRSVGKIKQNKKTFPEIGAQSNWMDIFDIHTYTPHHTVEIMKAFLYLSHSPHNDYLVSVQSLFRYREHVVEKFAVFHLISHHIISYHIMSVSV